MIEINVISKTLRPHGHTEVPPEHLIHKSFLPSLSCEDIPVHSTC